MELIARCLNKEKQAWDIFVERYSRLIYWAIRKRLKMSNFAASDDDVATIFQEVFLSILEGEKLRQLKNVKLICGWLAMIASNKTIDFMRKKIHNRQRFSEYAAPPDNTYEQRLFNGEIVNTVKYIINGLTDKEKIIISLSLFEEKTHKEIADMLGTAINSVSTVIARTKEKLRKELLKRGITSQAI